MDSPEDQICLSCGDNLPKELPRWMVIHHTDHCLEPKCIESCRECQDDILAVAGEEKSTEHTDWVDLSPHWERLLDFAEKADDK